MNILIFDTETVGRVSQDLVNIGYRILQVDMLTATAKELVARDYLDTDMFRAIKRMRNEKVVFNDDMPLIMTNNFMPFEKISTYDYLIKNKKIVSRKISTIYKQMNKDIERYKPSFGYAYNSSFDTHKFQKTAEKYNIKNPIENLQVNDIWAYATNYIVHTEDYIEWAFCNKIFSASGKNLSSSVESVTKYLLNNLDFQEQHTALDDTKYELLILLECLRRGADITKPETKMGYISTGKVFTDTVIDNETGEYLKIEYKKKIVKNGVTTYYN